MDAVFKTISVEVRSASLSLFQGEIIIVGDHAVFKDDLVKRFPDIRIDVTRASELDIDSETLRKGDVR